METYLYYCDAAIDTLYQGSGVAVVVRLATSQWDSCRIIATASRFLDGMTNNEAEYEAFILGLHVALQRKKGAPFGNGGPVFLLDSQIVVGQIAGCFAVRDSKLQPRHAYARYLLAQLPAATVIFIPRERNLLADALAKETLAAGLAREQRDKGDKVRE
ncbi:MAG: reverse transcriptase-like protein [Anaerolineae bacterium]|nr:reverse transcriptase-like protein [Anaerolineae bacterium]